VRPFALLTGERIILVGIYVPAATISISRMEESYHTQVLSFSTVRVEHHISRDFCFDKLVLLPAKCSKETLRPIQL